MGNARNEYGELNKFFKWAYRTRAKAARMLYEGKMESPEKMFLTFTSHDPVFISNGPAGLNGAVKGIGFIPKEEDLIREALEAYKGHIASYEPGDRGYSNRGLGLLMRYLYSEEMEQKVDFDHIYGVEMAFSNSYINYQANPQASLVFYQPPAISYEVKGKMAFIGRHHEAEDPITNEELPLLQQFVNAMHDVYHTPNPGRWKTRPVYQFTIEEIYDKSATKEGYGTRIPF